MRRIAPLSARATSKFAEIRRCEILPNADSAGGGAADKVDPVASMQETNACMRGWFFFSHISRRADPMRAVACSTEQAQAAMTD